MSATHEKSTCNPVEDSEVENTSSMLLVGKNERTDQETTVSCVDSKDNGIDGPWLSSRKAFSETAVGPLGLPEEYNHHLATPIHKLPYELLGLIFEEVVLTRQCKNSSTSALVLAAVCSRWRCVSLGCPALWSRIDFRTMGPERVTLFRDRSQGFPLELVSCNIFTNQFAQEFLASHLHLAETVEIVFPGDHDSVSGRDPAESVLNLLNTTSTVQYPLLKRFSCDIGRPDARLLPRVLETTFLGKQTPSLRHATLVGVRLPWNRNILSNLHTLILWNCPLEMESTYDDEICHILRDSPHLREFVLTLVLSGSRVTTPDVNRALFRPHATMDCINLPYLRSLTLVASADLVHHILSSIIVSILEKVALVVHARNETEVAQLLSLPEMVPQSVFSPLRALQYQPINTRSSGFNIGRINCYGLRRSHDSPACFLSFTWGLSKARAAAVADDFGNKMRELIGNRIAPLVQPSTLQVLSVLGLHGDGLLSDFFKLPFATVKPTGIDKSNDGKNIRAPFNFTDLVIRDVSLNLGVFSWIVIWCTYHKDSLREVYFDRVKFHVDKRDEAEKITRKLEGLASIVEINITRSSYQFQGEYIEQVMTL